MYRFTLVLPLLLLFSSALISQQQQSQQTPAAQKPPSYAAIPAEAVRQPNPVKPSPESIARAKKWWTMDCAMCHGANGDGKGDVAKDMKLQVADFTNPDTLKGRTDGELFYIIKNGHEDMPPEGPRVKTEENWDLVNYVRSLAKKKSEPAPEQKPQS